MRIALYGGSFNPPHTGHVSVARHAAESLKPDVFLWMPAGHPPHKALPGGSPTPAQRLEMSRLAAEGIAGVNVSDFEIIGGARYTFDTAAALKAEYNPDEILLIMGADMFLSLESWYRANELIADCPVHVYGRGGVRAEVCEYADMLCEKYGARVTVETHEAPDISSTALRGLLERGGGAEFLPEKVLAYIAKEGLYGFPRKA